MTGTSCQAGRRPPAAASRSVATTQAAAQRHQEERDGREAVVEVSSSDSRSDHGSAEQEREHNAETAHAARLERDEEDLEAMRQEHDATAEQARRDREAARLTLNLFRSP